MDQDDFERRHRDREERRRARHRRRRHHHGPKERVLHTRVSEQLSRDIRRVADELRVPASNLVRNVLEEAFSVVETVSENVGDLLGDILDEAEAARSRYRRRAAGDAPAQEPAAESGPPDPEADGTEEPEEFADVLGWQPLLLHREQVCADCGRHLRRGKRAFVGVTGSGFSSTILCRRCTEERA